MTTTFETTVRRHGLSIQVITGSRSGEVYQDEWDAMIAEHNRACVAHGIIPRSENLLINALRRGCTKLESSYSAFETFGG